MARSGWSKQGGFEIYLMDGSKGAALWNIVKEAGKAWDIGPGNPNAHERVESGLLSWGEGPKRHQLGVIFDGATPNPPSFTWFDITRDGRRVGDLTNIIWSYRLGANIGFALVGVDAVPGDHVEVALAGGPTTGRLVDLPFI